MAERFMTRAAVFTVVYNDKGEILLQRRGPNSYLAGHWDFPSGHVEQGEDMRATAARELQEETGLVGRVDDLRLRHVDHYYIEVDYLNFIFELRDFTGEPTIMEPAKCSGLAWFAPDELPEQCVNAVRAYQAAGFGASTDVTFSVTDRAGYERIMGEPLQDGGLRTGA
jgi:mutator protein MutT